MLPFLWGFVWQLYWLVAYFIPEKYRIWTMILVFADTVLLSQFALVTPEIPLVFAFLWAVNSVLYQRYWQLSFAVLLLGLISMRGLIMVAVIFLWHLIMNYFWSNKKNILNKPLILSYLPLVIIFIGFLIWHYQTQGWIIHNTISNRWDKADEWNSFYGVFRNAGILAWRILDGGRIILVIIFLVLIIKRKFWLSKIKLQNKRFIQLSILTFLSIALIGLVLLLSQNSIAQRYLMPFYICFSVLAGLVISNANYPKSLLGLGIIALFAGHFVVYPPKIAQSWVSTTAHFPYHQLRYEMLQYIDQKSLPLSDIGTSFPNLGSIKYLDCSDRFDSFVKKDLQKQDYIFYSNVYNDFSDAELDELATNWREEKRLQKGQVYVILYTKK